MVTPSHQGYRSAGRFAVHAAAALRSRADAHRKLAGDSSGLGHMLRMDDTHASGQLVANNQTSRSRRSRVPDIPGGKWSVIVYISNDV